MKLHRPDGSLLLGLAASDQFVFMPREADGQFDPKKDIRGHGPWVLEEWRPSAYVNWKRNPDYYMKGRPYYDRMERPILTEYAQQLAQFRTGNIHTNLVQLQDVIQMKKDRPQLRLRAEDSFFANMGPYLRYGYEGDSPFKDVRVRRAVSHAIDRETFLETMDLLEDFRRDGLNLDVAYCSVVPPGWPGFYLDPRNEKEFGPSAKYLKYDLPEAKKLLAAAGFPNGFEFDFWYNSENQYTVQYHRTRDVFAGMLPEIGLRPRMKGVPYQTYLDQYLWSYIYRRFQAGDSKGFNGMILAPAGAVRPSIDLQLFGVWHKDGSTFGGLTTDGKNAHLGDPKSNELIEKMLVETDRRRQESIVHEYIRYFTDQAYAVPRPGQTKGLSLTWPVIGNEGVWNTVGTAASPGLPFGPGNEHVESRINWWYDASQPPAKGMT
jgi:ABC-type transport system substrate-binding protein